MRMRAKLLFPAIGFALCLAPHVALAGHEMAGLWRIVIKMDGPEPNMPDLSKLPPEVQARMKAAGLGAANGGITVQRCRTPQDVAQDTPPAGADKTCRLSNVSYRTGVMTADMTCTGNFVGSGHMRYVWDSDKHFAGEVTMTGTSRGRQFTRSEKIEGTWLSAQCPAGQP